LGNWLLADGPVGLSRDGTDVSSSADELCGRAAQAKKAKATTKMRILSLQSSAATGAKKLNSIHGQWSSFGEF
jgi:hypothetical protein